MLFKRIATGAALMLALVLFVQASAPALAQGGCGLLQDCQMDGFYGDSGAGSGPWKLFRLSGSVGIGLAPLEGFPKGPSVIFKSASPFDAGILQQVNVTPGKGYTFKLDWAVERIDAQGWQEGFEINRRLGIDPFGGTDPNSPNVQWTGDYYANGKFDLSIDAYAKSPTITVFVRVQSPYQGKTVEVYLDAAQLNENPGMVPITVSLPTATLAPPPATATAAPRPTRAPTAAPKATIEPTDVTDTPEPSATPQPSQTPTLSETATRSAARVVTRARRATPIPTDIPQEGSSVRVLAVSLIGVTSALGFIGAIILSALALITWRRSKA